MTAAIAPSTYRVTVDADSASALPPALIEAVQAAPFVATDTNDLTQNIRMFAQGYLAASYVDASALTVEVSLGEDGNGTGVTKVNEWEITFTLTRQTEDTVETDATE